MPWIYTDGRVFVTARRAEGVPASLLTVSDIDGASGKLFKPYPDWSFHNASDCNNIVNVYRIFVRNLLKHT